MELSEKLVALRKERGLTQEQLAGMLCVSRTAVSKWETGKGTPSIDSLCAMAKAFDVTVDDLVSADAALSLARAENAGSARRSCRFASALLSLAGASGLVLPLYKGEVDGLFVSLPLYQYDRAFAWQFAAVEIAMVVCGIAALVALKARKERPQKVLVGAGDVLCLVAVAVFSLTGQPYPTLFFLAVFVAKAALLVRYSQLKGQ